MEELNLTNLIESDEHGTIKSEATRTYLKLRRKDFAGEKEETRFIKNVERVVRSSLEYKEFIAFCRETLNATRCVFTGWTFDETSDIELHHYPLTLFEIVKSVIYDKIHKNEEFSTFDIAIEVMELHFNMKVGVVPLAGTLHKASHNGALTIPYEFILGSPSYITEILHVPSEIIEKVNIAKSITINSEEYLPIWKKYGLDFNNFSSSIQNVMESSESNGIKVPKLGS